MVEVSNVRLEGRRLSGLVDGVSAWFDFPESMKVERRGEPFLAYAILLGQFRGERISIDAPVSPKILANLPQVQSLLKLWNPEFSEVEVDAPAEPMTGLNPFVVACFSGGVDSAYTLARNPEITHLLTLNDFDWHAERGSFEPARDKMQATASQLGKTFVPVETNVREVADRLGISWAYLHGPFLNLIASALGFERFYISSSHTYRELQPWGSHPLLDPLWESEPTTIVHYGADKWRTQKIEYLTGHKVLMEQLQVCSYDSATNCGRCSKCARTLLALKLLGADGPIPDAPVHELISKLDLRNDGTASFIWDVGRLARERGATDIQTLLERKLKQYVIKRSVRQVKRLFRPKRLKPGVVRLGPAVLF